MIKNGQLVLYRFERWRHDQTGRVISVTSTIPAHLIGLPGSPDQPTQPTPHASTHAEPAEEAEPSDNIDEPEYEPRERDYDTTLYKILTTQHGPASVTARMPRGDELDELGIEPGTPVLQIRRTMTDTHGRPLETTLSEATPGDQNAIMTL